MPQVSKTFAVDQFLAGQMIWFYMIPYGLAALLYGPLARSIQPRNILLICLGFFSVGNLISGIAWNIPILFASRVLAGLSGAAIVPLTLILIAKNSPVEERGRRVGNFFSFTFVSSLTGLFLSGVILWRWIFLIPAIGASLVLLAVYFLLPKFALEFENFQTRYTKVLRDQKIIRLFFYIFCISLFYHGIRQWLGVYFSKAHNLDQFLLSMLLTTVSVSGVFGEAWGGVLSDKLGRRKVIDIGVSLMILAVFFLLLEHVLLALFIIMFMWGLGWTFNHVGISTLLTDLPDKQLFESASLNSSVRFLSGGLGVLLAGLIMQRSFVFGFVILGTCLLILLFMTKKLILGSEV